MTVVDDGAWEGGGRVDVTGVGNDDLGRTDDNEGGGGIDVKGVGNDDLGTDDN